MMITGNDSPAFTARDIEKFGHVYHTHLPFCLFAVFILISGSVGESYWLGIIGLWFFSIK